MSVITRCLQISCRNFKYSYPGLYRFSSTDKNSDVKVILTDDGSTIVCWHPESRFPYAHTKALPDLPPPELREDDSNLKLQYRLDHLHRFNEDGPGVEQLAKLTYTNKHIWYPPAKKRIPFPDPPPDREGV